MSFFFHLTIPISATRSRCMTVRSQRSGSIHSSCLWQSANNRNKSRSNQASFLINRLVKKRVSAIHTYFLIRFKRPCSTFLFFPASVFLSFYEIVQNLSIFAGLFLKAGWKNRCKQHNYIVIITCPFKFWREWTFSLHQKNTLHETAVI